MKTRQFTPQEMYAYINRTGKFDKRFLKERDGGKCVFKYFQYTDYNGLSVTETNTRFFAVEEKNVIVALACIQLADVYDCWYISYLCVDPKYQGKGYASVVADSVFNHFNNTDLILETSSYTEEGFVKLKPLFNKLAEKYQIQFVDKGKL